MSDGAPPGPERKTNVKVTAMTLGGSKPPGSQPAWTISAAMTGDPPNPLKNSTTPISVAGAATLLIGMVEQFTLSQVAMARTIAAFVCACVSPSIAPSV